MSPFTVWPDIRLARWKVHLNRIMKLMSNGIYPCFDSFIRHAKLAIVKPVNNIQQSDGGEREQRETSLQPQRKITSFMLFHAPQRMNERAYFGWFVFQWIAQKKKMNHRASINFCENANNTHEPIVSLLYLYTYILCAICIYFCSCDTMNCEMEWNYSDEFCVVGWFLAGERTLWISLKFKTRPNEFVQMRWHYNIHMYIWIYTHTQPPKIRACTQKTSSASLSTIRKSNHAEFHI